MNIKEEGKFKDEEGRKKEGEIDLSRQIVQ